MKYLRIDLIVSLVDKEEKVLDVGTDHAFVPIFLYQKGITKGITAADANLKPLSNALKNIEKNGLKNKINVVHSNGFEKIEDFDSYTTIIIAGLGGKTIATILKQRKTQATLILNPTNHEDILRKALMKQGYLIIEEYLLIENNVPALVLKAKKSIKGYVITPKNQFLGPILKTKIFEDKNILEYYQDLESYNWKLYNQSKKQEHIKKYRWVKSLIDKYNKKINKK